MTGDTFFYKRTGYDCEFVCMEAHAANLYPTSLTFRQRDVTTSHSMFLIRSTCRIAGKYSV